MQGYIDLEASEELLPLSSDFEGKKGVYIILSALKFLVSLLSATLLYPIAAFFFDRWTTTNSRIDGKPLFFNGKLQQAYAIYFSGLLLATVLATLIRRFVHTNADGFFGGILNLVLNGLNALLNGVFITGRLRKWRARHTVTEESTDRSELKSNLLILSAVSGFSALLGLMTLGLGYPLSYSMQTTYYTNLTFVSGKRLIFTGKVNDAYKGWFISLFWVILTLGTYFFAIEYHLTRWKMKNTHFAHF